MTWQIEDLGYVRQCALCGRGLQVVLYHPALRRRVCLTCAAALSTDWQAVRAQGARRGAGFAQRAGVPPEHA